MMICDKTRQLAQAYVDRELDVASSLALEEHLASCPDCRAHHEALRRLQSAVAAGIGYPPAPAALRERVTRRLRAEAKCALPWWRRSPAFVAVPAALLLALVAVLASLAYRELAEAAPQRIVYHINEGTDPATALRNLANHLETAPNLKAIVVAHNKGVDFLLVGARDNESGELFEASVARLSARGIEFRVCGNTLARRAIDPQRIVPEARLVPSGIAEIARLQTQERYAYMRL
jgi:intracellular sulfur oxidation DsrE/DsrF family protein